MAQSRMLRDRDSLSASAGLMLTGEFELVVMGRPLPIPHMGERVLAYLALANRPVARSRLAGALWPDSPNQRAAKSLRTVLWRLHRIGVSLVTVHDDRLRLDPVVVVDVSELTALAHQLIHEPGPEALAGLPLLIEDAKLLPDWHDEWVEADRERYRLARLEALESASSALMRRGLLGDALMAGLAAVQTDPVRESARRTVVQIQIAQGNVAEAIRGYREYRTLLQDEFGVAPSQAMDQLLETWNLR